MILHGIMSLLGIQTPGDEMKKYLAMRGNGDAGRGGGTIYIGGNSDGFDIGVSLFSFLIFHEASKKSNKYKISFSKKVLTVLQIVNCRT